MAAKQAPLSQEVLAKFNQSTEPEGLTKHQHRASISTRRSSQSRDAHQQQQQQQQQPPRSRPQPLPLRLCVPAGPPASPFRSPAASDPSSPPARRESSVLSKRFSLAGWLLGGRTSFSGLTLPQTPGQKLENTYRMEPEQHCRFAASAVQKLLQTTLESTLNGACYNPASCSHLGQVLADMLRGKVKEICPPRYKVVCQVVIGQKGNQDVRVASRCLWNEKMDSFAVAEFQNNSLYALAIVHGIYSE